MSRRIAEGTLEAGKLADLVVLDKDPLKDIRHTNTIRYVMKNGELYEGNTLDQIWPKQSIGISTMKKQGHNVIAALKSVFSGTPQLPAVAG